jgi:hypothetical protein
MRVAAVTMGTTRRFARTHLCSSVFICGSLLLTFNAQAQTLFKCTPANGRVVYQQEPCEDPKRQSTVRPPDAIAPKSNTELKATSDKAAATSQLQIGQVTPMIADISLCVSDANGWDAKHANLVREWKARNGVAVAKFDADSEARAKATARMDTERARFAADKSRNSLNDHCERIAASLRAPAAASK